MSDSPQTKSDCTESKEPDTCAINSKDTQNSAHTNSESTKSSEKPPEKTSTEVEEIRNGLDSLNLDKYVQDGKNKCALKCPNCGSKILEKLSGSFVTVEKTLPLMYISNDKSVPIPKETVTEYFHVENMYTFDNIGFTHKVDDLKYLSCADCESGPLGYFEIPTSESYVALSRVKHV